jgi:hypothetical protein
MNDCHLSKIKKLGKNNNNRKKLWVANVQYFITKESILFKLIQCQFIGMQTCALIGVKCLWKT